MPVSPSAAVITDKREGLADAPQGCGRGLALLAVADQQHRIVDGDAQHRHAEADRDAVHEAKYELHHQGGRGDAEHHRHRDDADDPGRAEAPQQQGRNQNRRGDRQPLHVAAHGVGRLAREHGGSGGQQSARCPGSASANACRIAASTASWPAMSMPPARVLARISARSRSGANHTPSTLRTLLAPTQSRAIARKAPVGRPRRTAATRARRRIAATQQTLHVVAQRRDGERLRRGDRRQQIPVANRICCSAEPSRSRPPLLTKANWPERSSASVISRLIRARMSGGAPSMPNMTRLVAAPERNSSSIRRAASLRPRGRKSVMSERISIWLNTSPASNAAPASAPAIGLPRQRRTIHEPARWS